MCNAGKLIAASTRGHWGAANNWANEKEKKEEEAVINNTGESKQFFLNMLNTEQTENIRHIVREECYQILNDCNIINHNNIHNAKHRERKDTEMVDRKRNKEKICSAKLTKDTGTKVQNENTAGEDAQTKLQTTKVEDKEEVETVEVNYQIHPNHLSEKLTQEFESYAEVMQQNMTAQQRKVGFVDDNKEINIPVNILSGEKEFPCKLLLDTGAQRSFISQKYYEEKLQKLIKKKQNFVRMYGVGGNELKTSGEIELDIEVGKEIVRQKFIIAPLKEQGILGFDFCLNHKAEWRWKDKELTLTEESRVRHIEENINIARVTTKTHTEIPPRSEILTAGIVEHASEAAKVGMIHAQNTFLQNYSIGVAAVITTRDKNSVPLRLINTTETTIHLEKNTPIAFFSPAEVIEEITVRSVNNQQGGGEEFVEQFDEQLEELETTEKERFHEILRKYKNQFMQPNQTLGQTDLVQHKIHTKDHVPIKQRTRREPMNMQGVVKEELKKMEEKGIIEPSNSAWASPVVLCRKKDGSIRFCIDYRKLNSITEKDAYPLPRIEDNLDALRGAQWFSTLDLASGYWQVQMDEESKAKTAFCTKYGLYQFNVMPFGLCNAPGTFERLMETVLRGMQWERAVLYLDDIIIFSSSVSEQMDRLEEVFGRLQKANLTLKPSKCHFFQKKVEFLGHIVDKEGVHTDPKKIEAIQKWTIPTRVKEVRAFLGITGYYRRFIRDYGKIAKPLHQLTEKGNGFKWTEETNQAFEDLKSALVKAPILGYPSQREEDTFVLDTDASNCHIGAVLSQRQEGQEKVIAYGSKVLTKAERNYCVTRRELLSVVHFCIQYKHYLIGRKFLLRTDHGALVWIFQFKEPEGQLARWLELLSQFDMEITHRAGKAHGNGDGLSRRPCPTNCPTCMKGEQRIEDVRKIQTTPRETKGRTARQRKEFHANQITTDPLEWLRKAQAEDADLQEIEKWKDKPTWKEIKHKSKEIRTFWSRWQQMEKEDGLWRFRWIRKGETSWKWVLPKSERDRIIKEYHDDKLAGHFCAEKTEDAIHRSPYYIPVLRDQIQQIISQCETCERTKPVLRHNKAPMMSTVADRPLQRVAIDILGPLPESTQGNKFIVIIGDYFTKWTEAYPVPNHQAATIAKCVVEEYFNRFGIPEVIHTDQGRDFESDLFQEMCSLLEIEKTRTTPWHPQSDGMIERFNRTIETLLRQNIATNQKNWDEYISYCCAAYRNSLHSTTEYTPNELMLGRHLPMPKHIQEPVPEKWETRKEYNQKLLEKLQYAQEQTRNNNRRNIQVYKQQYNRKSWQRDLKPGVWVWLNNFNKKVGLSPKLQIRWEEEPYQIMEFLSEVVVKMKKWHSNKIRVVHLNKIKKVGNQSKWNDTSIERKKRNPILPKKPSYQIAQDGFPIQRV